MLILKSIVYSKDHTCQLLMDTKVTFVAMKTTKPVLKIGPEESLSLYKI